MTGPDAGGGQPFDGEPERPRRSSVLALAAAIAVVGLVVAGLLWPSRHGDAGRSASSTPTTLVAAGGSAPATTVSASATSRRSGVWSLDPYQGLGTWIDVFDYAPAYQRAGVAPVLSAKDVDVMAANGIRTIYLQAARFDDRTPNGLLDPALMTPFLQRAHARGMNVVGWYLPKLIDVDADLARLVAIHEFDQGGERFDGLVVDIEDNTDVADAADRNARLVDLTKRLRDRIGTRPVVGAAVVPPVVLEVINEKFWPGFPYHELAKHYDLWLPMTYWTVRKDDSGYKDGYKYVAESVQRLRTDLDQPKAVVHPIAGIGDKLTEDQMRAFLGAVTDTDAIGASIYDYRTSANGPFDVLRDGLDAALAAPVGTGSTTTTVAAPATTAPSPPSTASAAAGAATTAKP